MRTSAGLLRLASAAVLTAVAAGCGPPSAQRREIDRYFDVMADPTGQNIVVSADVLDVDEIDRFVLDTAWLHVQEEGEGLSVPAAYRQNGLRIGAGTPALRGEVDLARSRARSCRATRVDLTVLNQKTGSIALGEALPETVTLLTWDGRLEQHIWSLAQPRALLEVRPERLGADRIRLEIAPLVVSGAGAGDTLPLTDLKTTVVVPRGTPVAIGGVEQDNRSFGNTFFAWRSGRERRRRLVLVTAK